MTGSGARGSARLLRDRLLDEMEGVLSSGQTILVWGPWGAGKSTWLAEVYDRAASQGLPCGLARRTASLHDVTEALAGAYPAVSTGGRSQRQIRAALRMTLERRPGLLLLDDLQAPGVALRSFLRSLRGTGLGIAIAADVEHPRDRRRLQELRLAYYEWPFPPLRGEPLRRLFESSMPVPIHAADRRALLRMAAGRPGWIVCMGERLRQEAYWRGRRVRVEMLRADVSLDVLESYGSVSAG